MSQSVVLSDFIDEYKPQIESQLANQVKKMLAMINLPNQ
ncbi:hypothetical protein AKUFHON2_07500 [Apilactobacillus kunkeei]|nr:hypothetical protein AKUFHON2_07500 [Apilactobacillus kunkeei]